MRIETTIFVEPKGKARPRTVSKGGRTWTYTTKGTTHTESMIREHVLKLIGDKMPFGRDVPLKVEATFYRPKPKSTSKKVLLPTTKPDWDNLGKLLTDSLEKFVYPNDSAITTCVTRKRFGSPPRIELVIEEDSL